MSKRQPKQPQGRALRIELQDQRLNPARLSISARTHDVRVQAERRRALVAALDAGYADLVEAVRGRSLHLSDLAAAVYAKPTRANPNPLEALRGEIRRGTDEQTLDLSLGALVEHVTRTKESTRSRGTAAVYAKVTRRLLADFGPDFLLPDLGIKAAQDWLSGQAWAANTQAGALMVCGVLWRTAIEMEMEQAERQHRAPRLTRSPWQRVDRAQRRQTRHSFLEPHEIRHLLQTVRGMPEEGPLAIAGYAGLRAGEITHLRTVDDVRLDLGVLRVQPREGRYAWKPKHDHSVRDVPIVPELRVILERHIADYAGAVYFVRAPRWDQPLGYTTLKTWTEGAFRAAGFKYGREGEALTLHSLRHGVASLMVREGVHSTIIAKWLGNTAREVERTYAHLRPDDMQLAAVGFSRALKASEG